MTCGEMLESTTLKLEDLRKLYKRVLMVDVDNIDECEDLIKGYSECGFIDEVDEKLLLMHIEQRRIEFDVCEELYHIGKEIQLEYN